MRTRREGHSDHESSHGIDLAPMLDFVVNLLIFFIVTAVLVKESAVTVKRPASISADAEIADSIEVHDDGEIVLAGRVIDLRSVPANVERMIANDRKRVLIVAQEEATTGLIIAVVDQVHLGGVDDITFSTVR